MTNKKRGKVYAEIDRFLNNEKPKTVKQEFHRPIEGKQSLIKFPVYGLPPVWR